jgi:hypothetical protein
VIRPDRVTLYQPDRREGKIVVTKYETRTSDFLDALAPPPKNDVVRGPRDRRRRRARHAQGTTSAAITVSGAAFASSMGRFGRQYPTALFAAFNLRLGVWLPNPRYLRNDPPKFPRPNLVHLLKELTGAWDLDDHHVYVSDGGHRENLGLVELLRERCSFIICIDAAGDTPGSFTTLRQAADLARIETRCTIDLGPINHIDTSKPIQPYTILSGTYRDEHGADRGETVTILHIRPVVYPTLSDELVGFAAEDNNFPHYSTGNQFLTDTQFRHLVQYGRQAMLDSLADLNSDDRAKVIATVVSSATTSPSMSDAPTTGVQEPQTSPPV